MIQNADIAGPTGRGRVVDFHAHVVHPEVYALTVNHNVVSGFGMRPMEERPQPGSPRWPLFSKMTDAQVQIADMDTHGISHAVISTSTVSQSTYFAEAGLAAALDRQANEGIAAWVRSHADRFTGTFTLPLQNIDRALAELEFAVQTLGLRIANLPASHSGHYLGSPYFRPLWEAIAALDLTVFVHPDGIKDPGFQDFSLWNAIGQGIEETRAMASLIYEGTFESFPNLRVVISHAGGFLPTYISRLDRNATAQPASMKNIRQKPSTYLKNFFYDTVTYDPLIIDLIAKRVGVDRILFGSDYPFGDADPLQMLDQCELDTTERASVAGGNGAALLARTKAAQ
jgi:aminocarboxymuconate-semialdehyde decarboxylase